MRYDTGKPIGRGGMGEVLEAWDPTLERPVALKVLRHLDPETAERMRREARAQARVDHPTVCKVYEVGETADGRPYIAMQRIDGAPLDEVARDLGVEAIVRLMRTVAEAVHAAHAVGLVHRDLKPSNILVERRDDGGPVPYVVDFGIARETDTEGLTTTGQALGTPGYMSPEQAAGRRRLDRRTDVFSLGVVLYELLSGRLPYDGDSGLEVLAAVLRDEAEPLGRVAPGLPADLVTIVMTCIERDPERRYGSARALAEDLERYLADEPIRARPIGLVERLGRRIRRHPVAAALATVALLGLLGLGSYAAWTRHRARQEVLLAQRFGERLQRMESRLRLAHMAPRHDIRPERAELEREVDALEADLESVGPAGRGPGLTALGRARFELGRHEAAREALERARQTGYRSPELSLALGRTLTILYEEALGRAGRLADPELREAERERAAEELAAPAQRYLEEVESTAGTLADHEVEHLLGLLALLSGELGEAAARGTASAQRRAWFFEGHLLAGEAELRMATEQREAGDHGAAAAALERAGEAFAAAEGVAPSAPQAALGPCRVGIDRFYLAWDEASSPPPLGKVRAACEAALEIDPELAVAFALRAEGTFIAARLVARSGEDPIELLELVEGDARRALELDPGLASAWSHLGNALWVRARWSGDRGEDPWSLYERAAEVLEEGIGRTPGDRHLRLSLAHVLNDWGTRLAHRGLDPTTHWERASDAYRDALAMDSRGSSRLYNGLCQLDSELGYWMLKHGEDPLAVLERGARACERALQINPRYLSALNNLGLVHWTRGEALEARGAAADPAYDAAIEQFEAVLAIDPDRPSTSVNLGNLLVTTASRRVERGGDPRALLARAETAADATRGRFPGEYHYLQSRIALVRALHAQRDGVSPRRAFAAAERHGLEGVALNDSPDDMVLLARLYARRAAWRLGETGSRTEVRKDVDRGLEWAERALERERGRPDALAERARLESLRAETSTQPSEQLSWLARAASSACLAVEKRPALAEELVDLLDGTAC
ncbi:MAG: protein kinase [Thermoanaerobaculia bacterium]|nr:protein kinase [Thermoanaerobaculia bacterium]